MSVGPQHTPQRENQAQASALDSSPTARPRPPPPLRPLQVYQQKWTAPNRINKQRPRHLPPLTRYSYPTPPPTASPRPGHTRSETWQGPPRPVRGSLPSSRSFGHPSSEPLSSSALETPRILTLEGSSTPNRSSWSPSPQPTRVAGGLGLWRRVLGLKRFKGSKLSAASGVSTASSASTSPTAVPHGWAALHPSSPMTARTAVTTAGLDEAADKLSGDSFPFPEATTSEHQSVSKEHPSLSTPSDGRLRPPLSAPAPRRSPRRARANRLAATPGLSPIPSSSEGSNTPRSVINPSSTALLIAAQASHARATPGPPDSGLVEHRVTGGEAPILVREQPHLTGRHRRVRFGGGAAGSVQGLTSIDEQSSDSPLPSDLSLPPAFNWGPAQSSSGARWIGHVGSSTLEPVSDEGQHAPGDGSPQWPPRGLESHFSDWTPTPSSMDARSMRSVWSLVPSDSGQEPSRGPARSTPSFFDVVPPSPTRRSVRTAQASSPGTGAIEPKPPPRRLSLRLPADVRQQVHEHSQALTAALLRAPGACAGLEDPRRHSTGEVQMLCGGASG